MNNDDLQLWVDNWKSLCSPDDSSSISIVRSGLGGAPYYVAIGWEDFLETSLPECILSRKGDKLWIDGNYSDQVELLRRVWKKYRIYY